jgi:hypothetical protein
VALIVTAVLLPQLVQVQELVEALAHENPVDRIDCQWAG